MAATLLEALCGRNPSKGDLELLGNDRNDPPCLGSSLSSTSLPEVGGLPVFVALPHVMYNVVQLPGQVAGFLGSAHDPFQLNTDPAAPDFRLGELDLPDGFGLDRLDRRAGLLRTIDGEPPRVGPSAASSRDAYSEKALPPLRSNEVPTRVPPGRGRRPETSATATAGTSTARAYSWPADSSSQASDSSRSTTGSTTGRRRTGTRTRTSSGGSRTLFCPRRTSPSRRP